MAALREVVQTFRSAGRAGLKACTTLALVCAAARLDAATSLPLVDAVKDGDRASVRNLIRSKTDVNAREADGTTIDRALGGNCQSGSRLMGGAVGHHEHPARAGGILFVVGCGGDVAPFKRMSQ